MPNVSVKWQGKKFDVDVNTELEPFVFKAQLFELTSVLPERQKLVYKGKTIKDDDWGGANLPEGAMLMMLGSVEALLVQPKPAGNADESMSMEVDSEGNALVKMPSGLENLGNTCYMNSVYQSFRAIPELVDGIKGWTTSGPLKARPAVRPFLGSIHTLFDDLSSSSRESYMPLLQLKLMHQLYPQFATPEPKGGYQQQDANELFTELIREFVDVSECEIKEKGEKKKVPVRRFLEGLYEVRMKNLEDDEEPAQESTDTFMQLSCFLATETRYMQSGILNAMTEEIEKHSEKAARNCKYQKKTRISRLPANLVIQMVRFHYKEKEQINAKVLKDVKFPMILDAFDFCTPELQTKLMPQREAHKEYEDKKMELQRAAKLDEDKSVKGKEPTKFLPTAFEDDSGSNNSGYYELKAIITHKGRASNSGHYIAWVRVKGNVWACCDDESSHQVTEEEILKLSGGGDWHCSYILVYGPRPTPVLE